MKLILKHVEREFRSSQRRGIGPILQLKNYA